MEYEFEQFVIPIDSVPLKILHGVLFCYIEVTGFICFAGIAHLEHYGGDPMKRSIINKIFSQICFFYILHLFTR